MKLINKPLLKLSIISKFPPLFSIVPMRTAEECKMTVEEARKIVERSINELPVFDTDKFIDEIKADSSVKLYGSSNSDNYLIPVKRVEEILKSKLED